MDFQYNLATDILSEKIVSKLSDAQRALLKDIASVGPVDIYGAHLRMEKSLTTIQNAMKRLEGLEYVVVSKREEGKTGQIKKVYSLTFFGFCVAILVIITDSRSNETLETTDELLEKISPVTRTWSNKFDSVILRKWDFLMESYNVPLDVERSFQLTLLDALEYASQTCSLLWPGLFVPPEHEAAPHLYKSEGLLPRFEHDFFKRVVSWSVSYAPNVDGDHLDMLAYKARKDPEIWEIVQGFFTEQLNYHKTVVRRLERIFLLERLFRD